MKKTEYMVEVGSLRLSEQFKSDLKARMLEEYNKTQGAAAADEKTPPITVSGNKWKKYSKFAAIAACLLIAVSTASILSIKGIKTGEPADSSQDELIAENSSAVDDIMPEGTPEDAPAAPAQQDNDEEDRAVETEMMNEEFADEVEDAFEEEEAVEEEAITFAEESEADIEYYDDIPSEPQPAPIAVDDVIAQSTEGDAADNAAGYSFGNEDEADEASKIYPANPVTNPPDGIDAPAEEPREAEPRYGSDITQPMENTSFDEESECDDCVEAPQENDESAHDLNRVAKSAGGLISCMNYREDASLGHSAATLDIRVDTDKVRFLDKREYLADGINTKLANQMLCGIRINNDYILPRKLRRLQEEPRKLPKKS